MENNLAMVEGGLCGFWKVFVGYTEEKEQKPTFAIERK